MNSLDDFFDSVEAEQAAHVEDVKDYALYLLSTSTMKDDDDGLEDEIIDTNPTPNRWREIFERLKLNQLRAIDLPNCSQTEFTKSYKNMELIIEGVIKRVCKPMEFESGFRKCEVHVEIQDGKYPQTLALEFLKDDVDEAVALPEGKTIKARCNVRGSEWQKDDTQPMRVFMSLVPWKYEIVEAGAQPAPTQQPAEDGANFPF